MDGSPFDPASTLGADDPLRAWAAQQELDPVTGQLLLTDPQRAIDRLIARGVPPPAGQAMAYDDPGSGSVSQGNTDVLPPNAGIQRPGAFLGVIGGMHDVPNDALPVFGPNGKMMGNQTSAQSQRPAPDPTLTTPYGLPAPANSPFDPSPSVPLPVPRPEEAGPGASDISAAKKKSPSDAISDFSKSLSGVRPVQPPPVNPVGTPSVRSPTAAGATNIQNLLALIGQQSGGSPIQTLGRLLVAGKA